MRLRRAQRGGGGGQARPHRVPAMRQQPSHGGRGGDPCARGRELHRRVPAERWCVTREDLDAFVEAVRERHRRGQIPNDPHPVTGQPNPFHDDPRIGPNLHAVNKYVISPVTLASGGVSWALMLREEGLPIDFFITHNWQEGIYEFHTKVTESWPPGARHAWCCFLANPQPWAREDLKELLGCKPDLSDSPFARALGAPTCQMLLAVPNVTESIYARLWCVEEARRAIGLGLPVWLATDRGILHWPVRCGSVAEATEEMTTCKLHRSRAWSGEDVNAQESAEVQLRTAFRTVRRARCSDADDERRILAWIRGHEDEIDGMIHRLATQGQWLPSPFRKQEHFDYCTLPSCATTKSLSPVPSGPLTRTLATKRSSPSLVAGDCAPSSRLCAPLSSKFAEEGCDSGDGGRVVLRRSLPTELAFPKRRPSLDVPSPHASLPGVLPQRPLCRTDSCFVEGAP